MARAPANPPAFVVPNPTPIYRIVHIENLATLAARDMIHAPSRVPADGRAWRGIHATETQADRGNKRVPCGLRGVINDYVGFYFGPRSPMLYRIHTGYNVEKIDQSNIAYLVSSAQAVAGAGLGFVFTDRHSLAAVAAFHDDLARLDRVDWGQCAATRWNNTPQQPDRQEKKQAEFLVHGSMAWNLIEAIGVCNQAAKARVERLLAGAGHRPPVAVRAEWYY
ncbi:MAG: DUF4433 domain-containing protein [Phycisphaerales bacterium]|nr:DUF4433 domain-containing protein [Phycisphaerales bacterium]